MSSENIPTNSGYQEPSKSNSQVAASLPKIASLSRITISRDGHAGVTATPLNSPDSESLNLEEELGDQESSIDESSVAHEKNSEVSRSTNERLKEEYSKDAQSQEDEE